MIENNNESMAAVVETFIIEETAELIYNDEKLSEWNEHVAKLGLAGQVNITTSKSPIPFMFMKTGMREMFKVLCPRQVEVSKYNISPIPLEILKLISLATNEGYFKKISIWYDDKLLDPICVGETGYWSEYQWGDNANKSLVGKHFETKELAIEAGANRPEYYTSDYYLMGRWGDMKKSLEQLKEEARKRYVEEETVRCKKEILEAQRKLEDLEIDVISKFN